MPRVVFDQEKCKGCRLCVNACPKKIISLNKDEFNAKGFNPAKIDDMDLCIGCKFCATICPDNVIEIEK